MALEMFKRLFRPFLTWPHIVKVLLYSNQIGMGRAINKFYFIVNIVLDMYASDTFAVSLYNST